MLFVPELSTLTPGREARHIHDVFDAAVVDGFLGERGDADGHLAQAFLVPGGGDDDFLQRAGFTGIGVGGIGASDGVAQGGAEHDCTQRDLDLMAVVLLPREYFAA
jgi:hypothetical protein